VKLGKQAIHMCIFLPVFTHIHTYAQNIGTDIDEDRSIILDSIMTLLTDLSIHLEPREVKEKLIVTHLGQDKFDMVAVEYKKMKLFELSEKLVCYSTTLIFVPDQLCLVICCVLGCCCCLPFLPLVF